MSSKLKFPLSVFKNNIVLNEKGEIFAIYRLKSYPYKHKPKAEREIVIGQFEQLLRGLIGKGKILLLNEILHVDEQEYLAEAGALSSAEAYRHAKSARGAIASGGRTLRRYLIHQLKTSVLESNWKTLLNEFQNSVLGAFFGTEKCILNDDRISKALEAEDELFKKIRYAVDGRADFNDLDFIIRKTTKRVGVLPPPLPSRDGGIFTPAIISAFSDGCGLYEKPTHMVITSGIDEIQYQVLITFADMPKSMPEVGSEWIAALDTGEYPIDVAINYEIIKPNEARKKTSSKRRLLKGQLKENIKGNEEPSTEEEYAYTEGRYLEGKLRSGQPLAKISTTLALGGYDKKQVKANAKRLIERYSTGGYRPVIPIGDQKKCFYSFLPGADPGGPMIECDPGQIAAGGPTISLELGDGTGYLLGWSGAIPVFWKPGHAARKLKRSNAWFISGALGSGKSLLTKFLCYLAYLSGAYLFIIDPKDNEYRVFERLFPIKRIDLCPGGEAKINPFMLSRDPMQAKSFVIDYLSFALNTQGDKDMRNITLLHAVDRVGSYDPDKRNMYSCLEVLRDMAANHSERAIRKEAMECSLMLEAIKNSDLGQKVFGTGGIEEIARATVVNMQGLPLPRTAEGMNQGITPSERQGLGLLYLASAMAREVAFSLPKGITKVEVFDECWMLSKISPGIRILDEIVRMAARTFGTVPILATQNTTDMSNLQTLQNNITYVASFRAQDKREISASLDMLGAVVDPEDKGRNLYNIFPELESGCCVLRDAFGRIGEVYIDPHPEYLLQVFDTSPKGANTGA